MPRADAGSITSGGQTHDPQTDSPRHRGPAPGRLRDRLHPSHGARRLLLRLAVDGLSRLLLRWLLPVLRALLLAVLGARLLPLRLPLPVLLLRPLPRLPAFAAPRQRRRQRRWPPEAGPRDPAVARPRPGHRAPPAGPGPAACGGPAAPGAAGPAHGPAPARGLPWLRNVENDPARALEGRRRSHYRGVSGLAPWAGVAEASART